MPTLPCPLPATSSTPNMAAETDLINSGIIPPISANAVAGIKLQLPQQNVRVIITKHGNQLSDSDYIGTGCIITTVDSQHPSLVYDSVTALKFGDINGDGLINNADYDKLKNTVSGIATDIENNSIYFKAADLSKDNSLDAFDLFELDKLINNINNADQRPIAIR